MQKIIYCLAMMLCAVVLRAHDALPTAHTSAAPVSAALAPAARPALAAEVATAPATKVNVKAELAVVKLNKAVASYHVAKHKGFVARSWAKLKVAAAASKVAKADMGKDKKLLYILAGALAIIVAFVINSTLGFITLAVGATLFIIYLL